jgi:hypothetical protein
MVEAFLVEAFPVEAFPVEAFLVCSLASLRFRGQLLACAERDSSEDEAIV